MTLSTEKFFVLRGTQRKGSSMAQLILSQVWEREGEVGGRAQQFSLCEKHWKERENRGMVYRTGMTSAGAGGSQC